MKSGLPDGFSEKLRVVGLTHIVVASGTHLSILVEVARKIFGRVSRFAGVLFAGLFVVIFMALVGWTPSILRAGVMALLTLVSWYFGRKMAPWRMILLVMAGTLLAEPMFVIDLGFLLSFASYAGIMMLGPEVTKFFYGRKKPGWVASAVITTLSATVMTLPIILYYYGQVSLIAVLANLAILPTLPYVMGAVFIAGCVAGIPGIEMTVGWVVTRALDFHIVVVERLGELRQLLIEIPSGQGWVFALYGVVVAPIVMWYLYKRIAVRQKVCYNNKQVLN